jgi:hypothetical protein
MFGLKKRNKARKVFFAALQYAKGKIDSESWEDIADTAKHNEPKLALETLIYKLWENEAKISDNGAALYKSAFQLFGLGPEEYDLLKQCEQRGNSETGQGEIP